MTQEDVEQRDSSVADNNGDVRQMNFGSANAAQIPFLHNTNQQLQCVSQCGHGQSYSQNLQHLIHAFGKPVWVRLSDCIYQTSEMCVVSCASLRPFDQVHPAAQPSEPLRAPLTDPHCILTLPHQPFLLPRPHCLLLQPWTLLASGERWR